MDFTPKHHTTTEDSGLVSSSFDSSFNQSTPNLGALPRKRKIFASLDSPSSPKFSSTFNESLTDQLKSVNLRSEYERHSKVFCEEGTFKKIHSTPCTPEKQIKTTDSLRRPSSFVKCPEESPLKEARNILYPNLMPRKILSPLKFSLDKFKSPAKKCLFVSRQDLLQRVITNDVIMANIFKYLSNGDIFRMTKVSDSFKRSVLKDRNACIRFNDFKEKNRKNKENYMITPPSSPEKVEESPPSPNSRNFRSFYKRATSLDKNQSLTKCSKCQKPSVVQNEVAQCESLSCGLIQCLQCGSCAYRPEDFRDKCSGARLAPATSLNKSTFGDLSNTPNFKGRSFLCSSMNESKSESGFCSDLEQTPAVKRNLSICFGEKKGLAINNSRVVMQKKSSVERLSAPIAQVIPINKKVIEIEEPSSPPKVRQYAACSKQSKRNLKRLTR
ncbi:uncharacterized protein LOC109597814 [Aethina tumida]|uniref:uncharacterized protein LOC109597814 n=1 Tax=Aethina tumida TaxID=116153 RepID=UPI00096B1F19|nr:uncharacterized protein LOC109597814 [Aethina tumida]